MLAKPACFYGDCDLDIKRVYLSRERERRSTLTGTGLFFYLIKILKL